MKRGINRAAVMQPDAVAGLFFILTSQTGAALVADGMWRAVVGKASELHRALRAGRAVVISRERRRAGSGTGGTVAARTSTSANGVDAFATPTTSQRWGLGDAEQRRRCAAAAAAG